MKKQYGVIGLGIFGRTIAQTLAQYDVDVVAIDKNYQHVEKLAGDVTQSAVLDSTQLKALQEMGMGECDVVVVAIGSHLETAILTVLNLKELGVAHVVAKANNETNAKILLKIGADEVIQPELNMGERVGKALLSEHVTDVVELDEAHSVMEIIVPDKWCGKTLGEIDVRRRYNMNILGVRQHGQKNLSVVFDPEYIVQNGDQFVVFARTDIAENFDVIQFS